MKEKKKKFLSMVLAGACLIGITGCGSNDVIKKENTTETTTTEIITTEVKPEQKQGYQFTDDLGRTVTISSHERVATLMGSFADIWMLAGGNIIATTKDTWTSFDLELSQEVVNIGGLLEPDMEQLIAAKPDLVLASANLDAQVGLEEMLTQAGITVVYFDVNNFDDYLHMLDVCTQITGERSNYDTYGTAVLEQVNEAKAKANGSSPKILYLRASTDNVKAKSSKGNVGSEILKDLGCINIADSDSTLVDNLSMEAIITADPDYIFVTTQGENTSQALSVVENELLSNPAWNSLTAIQKGNYYVLDKNLYNTKPNAKWGEAYEYLADILYGKE